ncbi:RNA-binding domain-containing protein [Fistulina hepatica ATCC 64428]|nr:RNA-binding domain-containing protein [Fistulina hepatica ATCC 64428]
MSDALAAQVTENGAPPVTQDKVEEPGFKVFVGNLAYATTDDGLKTFFAPLKDDVLSAQVIMRGTRSAGYGFVALSTLEAAQKAVELLHKEELDGREVIVEVAKPPEQKDKERKERKSARRRPGRRGSKAVPGEVSEAEANGEAKLADAATETPTGTDEAAKPKKKKKSNVKEEVVPAAEGEVPQKTKPRKKSVRPSRAAGEDPVGEPSKTMLFVANLGFNVDDAGLEALFTEAGITVTSARIVRRRWGKPRKSKGYGFVDVGGEDEQKKAIEVLQGKEVGGRSIAVKVAVNSPNYESGEEGAASTSAEASANRKKKRLEVMRDAREEGLGTSLFERAKQEEEAGGSQNKALSMMMKMGFKPGQALGQPEPSDDDETASKKDGVDDATGTDQGAQQPPTKPSRHLVNPIAVTEWTGRTGIGVKRRPPSPPSVEMAAKMVKMAEDAKKIDFRDRARTEYEDRRAAGKLRSAQRTCRTLDEKAEKDYNVLWLDPENPHSFPTGLIEGLETLTTLDLRIVTARDEDDEGIDRATRLRRQMREDALRPIDSADDEMPRKSIATPEYAPDVLEEAVQFLRLPARDRLSLVLAYLRTRYAYCLYCGTQYDNEADMKENCPGPEEDDHD